MKIHVRFDESNKKHTHFTIYVNGQNCGQLCMETKDTAQFYLILLNGTNKELDEFVSSGKLYCDEERDGQSKDYSKSQR